MRLLLLALALPLALASPLPNFNEIEKRWAEGHSEVCAASAFLPGCYVHAWVASLSKHLLSSPEPSLSFSPLQQQIHTGLTHRDMTPAWPMHARDSEGSAFATATDERSIEASVLRTRAGSLMEQMRDFAERFMRSKGLEGVIARRGSGMGEGEEVPVLRPRKGVRWSFGEES
ncbi:hypothetical protein M409DRAFT_55804 [Zasmidium cellare ATCC 36951]|uniref:Uncharacterized protein n=1 Tax=Zasmidium cellare ATCC 36951 TaxID=1080233 RepID=A0A6A6CHI9_ZASCE|nr:uncharacterized protein M409DRAFT_55804 [Zasmidium cellare ATCC 36951]KAF2165402.1 hypothetical protein M409DRAFT_55804 [Zasmidium cellare ATCC 36951]